MAAGINISLEVERLIQFGMSRNLIDSWDALVVRNNLFDLLKISGAYTDITPDTEAPADASHILNKILQYCFEEGILPDSTVTQRDLLAAKIMGFIAPRPATVAKMFNKAYINSPMEATDYLYSLCLDLNYIQEARAKKNYYWENEEPYGRLEFTNNFQRHEKTPEEIALRDKTKKPDYPLCEQCVENVGFTGDLWLESGRNRRVAPLTLAGKQYFMRFSSVQCYGERFFVSQEQHTPMEMTEKTYEAMLDFIDKFPHCFIGLDAVLPGMGNNNLEHGCFQGGCHVFPIDYAETVARYSHELFDSVEASFLRWPVSVIRLESDDICQLVKIINYMNGFWRDYTDEGFGIYAYTEREGEKLPHNALSIAARKNYHGCFEVDIALRNNRTSDEFPNGVFSQRDEYRHIMSENVGLIGIMGLGVFPGSFDSELLHIMSCLMVGKKLAPGEKPQIDRHLDWVNLLVDKYGRVDNYETARTVICFETARAYAKILESCGVFKMTDDGVSGFKSLMEDMGFIEESDDMRL